VEAVASRISIRFVGCFHANCDHLFGHVLVIRSFFFFFFAIHANRLMIIDGQQPAVLILQRLPASPAIFGTCKLFFPIFLHFSPRFVHFYGKYIRTIILGMTIDECRMSNVEVRNSTDLMTLKDRAQRFHPSSFCGSLFDILRFADPATCSFI
jgi:hypothetical protein